MSITKFTPTASKFVKRTPKYLRRDNFNFEEYLRRVAEFDVKHGVYNRVDYIGSQDIYINRRNELLQNLEKEKSDE